MLCITCTDQPCASTLYKLAHCGKRGEAMNTQTAERLVVHIHPGIVCVFLSACACVCARMHVCTCSRMQHRKGENELSRGGGHHACTLPSRKSQRRCKNRPLLLGRGAPSKHIHPGPHGPGCVTVQTALGTSCACCCKRPTTYARVRTDTDKHSVSNAKGVHSAQCNTNKRASQLQGAFAYTRVVRVQHRHRHRQRLSESVGS